MPPVPPVDLLITSVADEEEGAFSAVGPIHNPGEAQERSQDLHQAWGQHVHLIKEEEEVDIKSEIPLDPDLKTLLVAYDSSSNWVMRIKWGSQGREREEGFLSRRKKVHKIRQV